MVGILALRMRGNYQNGRNVHLKSGENDEICFAFSGKPSELDIFVLRMVEAPFTIRKTFIELFWSDPCTFLS